MQYPPEDQYLSMMRAYESLRVLATDTGSTAEMGYEPLDEARRFFLECYAFKDWLKKDPRVTEAASVEQYVSGSIPLSIAADMCNSFKHAGLDRQPRGAGTLDGMNVAHTLTLPSGRQPRDPLGTLKLVRNPRDGDSIQLGTHPGLQRAVATARVVLTVAGKQYDAFQVATDCVAAWGHYLENQGLRFGGLES